MEDRQKKVLERYGLAVKNRYRTRGAWVLETDKGLKLLKEYEKVSRHFYLENKMKEHLRSHGMGRLDFVVENKEGEAVTTLETGDKYVITDWYYGDECDLRNRQSLHQAALNLAHLHNCLKDFCYEDEFCENGAEEKFIKHNRELKRIYTYMRNKKRKNEFEIYAMDCFHSFYEQGCEAQELFLRSPYADGGKEPRGYCHGEYNHHNVIFTKEGIATTNFGKACRGVPLMDLCYLLRKAMEKNNWEINKGKSILEGYESKRCLEVEEKEYLYVQLLFPEKFWKLMNQYYNRKKAWMPQRNMEKLIGVKEQNEGRKVFLDFLKTF